MTIQYINTGTSPNSGNGDILRLAFTKINHNFGELYGNLSGIIPSAAGESGKLLSSDGTNIVWIPAPSSSQLSNGAYSASLSTSGIFALSTGSIITIGGVPLDNSVSLIVSDTAPINPVTGELWYDEISGRTYVWYDTAWVDSNPRGPAGTQLPNENGHAGEFLTTDGSNLYWTTATQGGSGNGYTGSAGADGSIGYVGSQGSSMTLISDTLPVNQTTGTFWYNSITGRTYIRFDDSWVDASPASSGYNGSVGYAGSQGGIGYTGSTGADSTVPGYTGSIGADGAPGADGIGYTGSTGADGIGYTGSTGADGIGYTGSTGADSTVVGYTGSQGNFGYVGSAGTSQFSSARTTVTTSTISLTASSTSTTVITGFKTYILSQLTTSVAAWVRVYSDAASQTADLSRIQTTDPLSGSGVIAEVITQAGSLSQKITPGIVGVNLDDSPNSNIYVTVTNLSGSTNQVIVTLTVLQLEA